MTTRHQIQYKHKVPALDPYHAIEAVGGKNFDGSTWRLPLADAVARVEDRTYEFFVSVDGAAANVYVATSPAGNKYLRTDADGLLRDNLLSLPEFPVPGIIASAGLGALSKALLR